MGIIDLRYGSGTIPFEYDAASARLLEAAAEPLPLEDVEINERLDQPIASPRFEEMIRPGETVLIAVPDATRRSGSAEIVNLLVRRLIANGTPPHDIRIIFATGIHRSVTAEEKDGLLTPFIAQRINTLDHDPRDLLNLIDVGKTSTGIDVSLSRAAVEADNLITVGAVAFHYFAGFTGGRKLICPGLASSRTISATHKLAFDAETLSRRDGVGPGMLDGNAVHEAFLEAASFAKKVFSISTIVDGEGRITDLFCGDLDASHRAACNTVAARNTVYIDEKRDVVVASAGGFPLDINLIQAHKALDSAARACREGGSIILIAECREGTGRTDLLDWFTAENSVELAKRLTQRYRVNGQTAWNLLSICERFRVKLHTTLDDDTLAAIRATRFDPEQKLDAGYILPDAAKIDIRPA